VLETEETRSRQTSICQKCLSLVLETEETRPLVTCFASFKKV